MKIKHFSILLAVTTLTISLVVSSAFFYFFYLPSFQEEALHQQKKELQAIKKALNYAQRDIATLTQDYAIWDEMVAMIQGTSRIAPLNGDTMLKSYELAQIDGIYLFDVKGGIKFSYAFEPFTQLEQLVKDQSWQGTVIPSEEQIASNRPSQRSGLLLLGGQPVYFSNAAVLPSIGQGEVVGSLMMVRILDADVIKDIQELTLSQFSIVTELTPQSKQLEVLKHDTDISAINSVHEWLVADVFGTPAFHLRLSPRGSYSPGFFSVETITILLAFFVVSLASALPSAMMILKPMQRISRVLDKISSKGGMVKVPTDMFIDEVEQLAVSFNYLLAKLDRHQNYLESLAMKDPLTGIANRRGLETFAGRAFEQWQQGQGCIGFLMIDIDDFKPYNDTQGHLAGDRIILNIAQTLMMECRRRGELVTRYGGEEFCVIIHGHNIKQMEVLGRRMLKKVRGLNIPHPIATTSGIVTVSIGAVFFGRFHPQFTMSSWQQMLDIADQQLYLAKEQGKNRMCTSYETADLKVIP